MADDLFLQIFAVLFCLYFCVKFLLFAWIYIRPSSVYCYLKDGKDSKDKNWALITGASDGIGQAFADELCRRGFNVVLHGRNATKLEKVQKELRRRHPESQTRIIVCDANLSPSSELERDVLAKVEDLTLSILINNIGGTASVQPPSETFSTIDQHSVDAVDGLLNINARFPSQITRILLPLLLKRPQSLIMNMSSGAEHGLPYLSVYSGTKAYISAWSRALTAEMKAEKRNVEVLGIVVGSVGTTSNGQPASLFHPTPKKFVRATLERVGCGKATVCGYLPHALQVVASSFLPEWMIEGILINCMKGWKIEADAKTKKL